MNKKHYPILALTKMAASDLTQYSVVTTTGAYPSAGTDVALGVVDSNASTGNYFTVVVKGFMPIMLADGETVAVGDLLGIDASGLGTAPASANKVIDLSPVVEVEGMYAFVLL